MEGKQQQVVERKGASLEAVEVEVLQVLHQALAPVQAHHRPPTPTRSRLKYINWRRRPVRSRYGCRRRGRRAHAWAIWIGPWTSSRKKLMSWRRE